jgi:hypothetical protein
MYRLLTLAALSIVAGCATTPVADRCAAALPTRLDAALADVGDRVANGCEYQFDRYFEELLQVAAESPDRDNPRLFSDFLVDVQEAGVISGRQARTLYNRYFSVKFVSFTGDYNTCSRACPARADLLAKMQGELGDKELGLVRISSDSASYYRADNLLKETDLVLEATCRACAAGRNPADALAGANR